MAAREVNELAAWFDLERGLADGPIPASVRSIAARYGWTPKRAHDFLSLLEESEKIVYERGRPRNLGEIRLPGTTQVVRRGQQTLPARRAANEVSTQVDMMPEVVVEPTAGQLAVAVARTWAATQSAPVTNGSFRRAIGQAKQVVRLADNPRDLAEAIHGIEMLWPFSEGRPWGMADLARKFHEAREAYYRSQLPLSQHDALADWLADYGGKDVDP